jgi:hypothetical protein
VLRLRSTEFARFEEAKKKVVAAARDAAEHFARQETKRDLHLELFGETVDDANDAASHRHQQRTLSSVDVADGSARDDHDRVPSKSKVVTSRLQKPFASSTAASPVSSRGASNGNGGDTDTALQTPASNSKTHHTSDKRSSAKDKPSSKISVFKRLMSRMHRSKDAHNNHGGGDAEDALMHGGNGNGHIQHPTRRNSTQLLRTQAQQLSAAAGSMPPVPTVDKHDAAVVAARTLNSGLNAIEAAIDLFLWTNEEASMRALNQVHTFNHTRFCQSLLRFNHARFCQSLL